MHLQAHVPSDLPAHPRLAVEGAPLRKFIDARIYRRHDEARDILADRGIVTQAGAGLPSADEEIDLRGRLMVPPYVDPHLHLDYVYTARSEGAANASGTPSEGIARWRDVKKAQTLEDAKERAPRGIREEVTHGVQFIRTHVDVDDPRLTGLRAMLEIRERLADAAAIQIVALPHEGMYADAGGDEPMEEANDPWYPIGNGNTRNALDHGIHRAHNMSFDALDRCLELITYHGAKTRTVEDRYGIEVGKPANFLVPYADTPFEAVRQRARVLASNRHGEYLFSRPEPGYEVELDLFGRTG